MTTLQIPVDWYWWHRAELRAEGCALASHGVGSHQSTHERHDSPYAWAIDLVLPVGVALMACASGQVRDSRVVGDRWSEHSGNYTDIIIPTVSGDILVTYSHLRDAPLVQDGDVVHRGEIIGYVGETGNANGPHLHMEMMRWPKRSDDDRLCPYRVFTEGIA